MKEKVKEYFWTDRINNRNWMQKLVIELTGDIIMIIIGLIVGYYMKTMFI